LKFWFNKIYIVEDVNGKSDYIESVVTPAPPKCGAAPARAPQHWLKSVLQIRDVYPGSGFDHFLVSRIPIRIRPYFIPDPSKKRGKNLTVFMQE
jgi:hypothetical protein